MNLSPTAEDEIKSIIKELKANETTGPNSIPTKILNNNKNELAKPLCDLINLVLQSGAFPDILKNAKFIQIYKKGDPLECNNYRPISLLSSIAKLIEKLIHVRLAIFLETNKCFYENQFGFRKRHSSNHTVITITEKIRHTLDNNRYMCGVFLGLQKAFDTVNHDILPSKLHFYGFRNIFFKLIKSYLTNRKQYTYINDTESTALISTHGVPRLSFWVCCYSLYTY